MLTELAAGFSTGQWAVVSALLIGMSKSGIKGLVILTIPSMAGAFGARASTGIILPIFEKDSQDSTPSLNTNFSRIPSTHGDRRGSRFGAMSSQDAGS